jgi:hypothetical protein
MQINDRNNIVFVVLSGITRELRSFPLLNFFFFFFFFFLPSRFHTPLEIYASLLFREPLINTLACNLQYNYIYSLISSSHHWEESSFQSFYPDKSELKNCAVPPPPLLVLFAKSNGKSNRCCPSVQCAVAVGRGYDGRGGCGMVHQGTTKSLGTNTRQG